MSSKSVGVGWVEGLRADLLKLEPSHHRVEEDFEELQVVTIGWLHDLDPLDRHLELVAIMFGFQDWNIANLSETVYAESPVNVELQLLLDLVPDVLQQILSELLRVVWDLRVKLAGVFVDTCNACLVVVDLEIVGEQLESLACSFSISCWLLGEQLKSL